MGTVNWSERYTYVNGELFHIGSNKRAGCLRPDGYLILGVDYKCVLAHRIIYEMHNETIPVGFDIDHINGNRSDNRIQNLRLATRGENLRNACIRSDNSSGVKGVFWNTSKRRWTAKLQTDNTQKHVGHFRSIELATIAINKARTEMHKEFSNTGVVNHG